MQRISTYLFSLPAPLTREDLRPRAWSGSLEGDKLARFRAAPQLYIGEALYAAETKTVQANGIIKGIKELLGDRPQILTNVREMKLLKLFEGHNLSPLPINTDLFSIEHWLEDELGKYIYIASVLHE